MVWPIGRNVGIEASSTSLPLLHVAQTASASRATPSEFMTHRRPISYRNPYGGRAILGEAKDQEGFAAPASDLECVLFCSHRPLECRSTQLNLGPFDRYSGSKLLRRCPALSTHKLSIQSREKLCEANCCGSYARSSDTRPSDWASTPSPNNGGKIALGFVIRFKRLVARPKRFELLTPRFVV